MKIEIYIDDRDLKDEEHIRLMESLMALQKDTACKSKILITDGSECEGGFFNTILGRISRIGVYECVLLLCGLVILNSLF